MDIALIGVEDIASIKLYGSHNLLLADGKAQVDFVPFFYTKDGYEISESQIDTSQIEYYTSSGELISDYYSTTD